MPFARLAFREACLPCQVAASAAGEGLERLAAELGLPGKGPWGFSGEEAGFLPELQDQTWGVLEGRKRRPTCLSPGCSPDRHPRRARLAERVSLCRVCGIRFFRSQ